MKDRGIAMVAGLVLLAAISLLAGLCATGTMLQRNMAGNYRGNSLALENASVALAFARAWLVSHPANERDSSCESDCILPVGIRSAGELPRQPEFEGRNWWRDHGYTVGYHPGTATILDDPGRAGLEAHWLIEEIHFEPGDANRDIQGKGYYRLYGRGEGHRPSSVAVIEAIVARPWGGEIAPGLFPPDGQANAFCDQAGPGTSCGVLSWRRRR